jgi:hypothetical protein
MREKELLHGKIVEHVGIIMLKGLLICIFDKTHAKQALSQQSNMLNNGATKPPIFCQIQATPAPLSQLASPTKFLGACKN